METELTIGQAIRKARGKVSLKELAKRTGYSLTYLSDVQCDKTMPSLKALMAIAKALDVTPGMILDAVHDPGIFDRDTFAKRIMAMYDAAHKEAHEK